jgi:hypothetical protein
LTSSQDLWPHAPLISIYHRNYSQLNNTVNSSVCSTGDEVMEPPNRKDNTVAKPKRYESLETKYRDNPEFELVYNKIPLSS